QTPPRYLLVFSKEKENNLKCKYTMGTNNVVVRSIS
ncbi:MAG: hypothetical protein ACI90V_006018, partial [Bacillariaceae sp.]